MITTLYVSSDFDSPWAMSAFVALTEKGLPFELAPLDFAKGEHRAQAYRRSSLSGRIPALCHDGFWLSESSAIAEYLDETFPTLPRLLPSDLRERARARQVMAWMRSDLLPLREARPSSTVFHKGTKGPMTPAVWSCVDRLLTGAGELIRDGRTSMFGAWCLADTDLAMCLQRLNLNQDPLPSHLRAFCEAQWKRPSVQKWLSLAKG